MQDGLFKYCLCLMSPGYFSWRAKRWASWETTSISFLCCCHLGLLTPGSCSKYSVLDFTFLGQYLPVARLYGCLIHELTRGSVLVLHWMVVPLVETTTGTFKPFPRFWFPVRLYNVWGGKAAANVKKWVKCTSFVCGYFYIQKSACVTKRGASELFFN